MNTTSLISVAVIFGHKPIETGRTMCASDTSSKMEGTILIFMMDCHFFPLILWSACTYNPPVISFKARVSFDHLSSFSEGQVILVIVSFFLFLLVYFLLRGGSGLKEFKPRSQYHGHTSPMWTLTDVRWLPPFCVN